MWERIRIGLFLAAVLALVVWSAPALVQRETAAVDDHEPTGSSTTPHRESPHTSTTTASAPSNGGPKPTVEPERRAEVEAELSRAFSDEEIGSYAEAWCYSRNSTVLICDIAIPLASGNGPRLEVTLNPDGSYESLVVGAAFDEPP